MANDKSSSGDPLRDNFDLDNPKLASQIKGAAMQSGNYPYSDKLSRKKYERALRVLQIELVKVQAWAQDTGARLVLVFEGRDAAGKGGTINAIRAYLNPRNARIAALPKPTEREQGQWYFQRYIAHLPSSGELVLFDRSWYNRAGVEPVMGFCTPEQHRIFLQEAPKFEQMLVDENIHLFKFWLNIGREMQMKRFHDRAHDPLKQWKLSPMDVASLDKWGDYTEKRNLMLKMTHTASTPWTIVRSNDKRRARLNSIRHVLANLDYDGKDLSAIGKIDPLILGQGPDFLRLHEAMDFDD
uniref:polyphosphate kinase 2 n=1 Tax=Pararhizobium sp. IMCC3301 TaxID=3067904 RepID=UPI00274114AF|nr:polyphosphate kinase 2 [Pararhizobium sp. IMCC3301]